MWRTTCFPKCYESIGKANSTEGKAGGDGLPRESIGTNLGSIKYQTCFVELLCVKVMTLVPRADTLSDSIRCCAVHLLLADYGLVCFDLAVFEDQVLSLILHSQGGSHTESIE